MQKTLLTAAALALVALPTLGFAQAAPQRPMPVLDFAAADADSDGTISRAEWQTYTQSLRQGMMGGAIEARADALIAAGDANGDGALSRDELVAGMTTLGETRREDRMARLGDDHGGMRRGGRHEGRQEGRGHGRGERQMPGDAGFSRIDRNGDGAISAEELAEAQQFMERMGQRRARN